MGTVNLMIDGHHVTGQEGMTILDAAGTIGIEIPVLCHKEGIKPAGVCRICVVEIEGARNLAGACHTPISEGMVVRTRSPKALSARRANIELMMTAHTGPCLVDPEARNCELHRLASDLEVGSPRFHVRKQRYYPLEQVSPYIHRDMSKCILCRRCIGACREIAGHDIFGMAYRGFDSKVVVDFDEPLNKDACRDCGLCIDYCPTSALIRPEGAGSAKTGGNIGDDIESNVSIPNRDRGALLEVLKQEQAAAGYISREFMTKTARSLSIPLSEVYGIVTFYSFLSSTPTGRHAIRICKSLPCYLKDAPMIIESVHNEIGILPGEATVDGRFSFQLTNCIGACDRAPAMLVNQEVHGDLTPGKISRILASYV